MKENSQSKQGKSLLVFNQVVVRIMIHTNPKIKIKVNQLDLLLELEANMEDSVVKILLNLDIIMRISLGLVAAMIHIQKDKLLTPVKSETLVKKTRMYLKNLKRLSYQKKLKKIQILNLSLVLIVQIPIIQKRKRRGELRKRLRLLKLKKKVEEATPWLHNQMSKYLPPVEV